MRCSLSSREACKISAGNLASRLLSLRYVYFNQITGVISIGSHRFCGQRAGRGRSWALSGFRGSIAVGPAMSLHDTSAAAPITITQVRVSKQTADKVRFVDEEATVQFRLVGLPAGAKAAEYRIVWKFDDNHHGSIHTTLEPEQTAAVKIRYNKSNSSHRIVELRVSSADGHWTGVTTFPIARRLNDIVNVGDDNVLLVPMKSKDALN